jgi:hypothetical protein
MGLYADDQQIWLSTLYTLYRFTNSLEPGQAEGPFPYVADHVERVCY